MSTEELMALFGYTNRHAFYNAVRLNNFPVKTHRICGRRYAFTADVRTYFDELRQEA